MKYGKIKIAMLCIIVGLLTLTSFVVVYVDCLLVRVYQQQQKSILLAAQANPVPVLTSTPTSTSASEPTSTSAPTPTPTRAPQPGDIANVSFPDYDTGIGATYSYQSNELRIALNKVQEDGVTYYIADIWMRNINCFRTAFSNGKFRGKREHAEKIAQDNNAVLAVNGDFLNGLVIRNGELYSKAELRPTPTPAPAPESLPETDQSIPAEMDTPQPTEKPRPERAACVLYGDGRLVTEEYKSFRSNKAMKNGAWQGWQFGPTLVRNGKAAKDVKSQGRNPRCILGYYEPGHYCIIMIDGRQKGYSIGMNFEEMINLCTRLGLTEAYNLDGGASAIMVFNGQIINQPSGSGESRQLPDMVIIGEYLDPEHLFVPASSPTS